MLIKLTPAFQSYLWGGNRLKTHFGKQSSNDIIAESWELSCHPDGYSTIATGKAAGATLRDWIDRQGVAVLGKNCERFADFPILVKLIDAKQSLSVQVHPNDAYALEHEGQYGKTEMWYVLDHEPGAFLYHGFAHDISAHDFENAIKNGTITEHLRAVEVKRGDVFFIEAGTIHAIGAGIVIAEIQQNSNLTYRLFDYGRVDANGQGRQLHIKQALEVSKITAEKVSQDFGTHVAACEYFVTDKLVVNSNYSGFSNGESFCHMLVVAGKGHIECAGESIGFCIGDSFFIAANSGEYHICGKCEILSTTIPNK